MGRLSYSEISQQVNGNVSNNDDRPYYWYFGLPKEGDSAIIRIIHDSVEDLEVLATHEVRIDGKYRKISCLRGEKDPLDMCPLCSSNYPRRKIVYLHIIEYVVDSTTGQVVPTPRVWEKPLGFINELKEYMDAYAPLSDQVFKVKRTGVGPQTRYTFIPLNNTVAPESIYPKCAEFFDDYEALGVNVQERDAENILTLMNEGKIAPMENKYSNTPKPAATVTVTPQVDITRNALAFVPSDIPFDVQENVAPVVPPQPVVPQPVAPVVPPQAAAPVTPQAVAPVVPPTVEAPAEVSQGWANPTPRRVYNPGAPATPPTGFRPTRM